MPLTLGPLERSQLPQIQRWRNLPALLAHTRGQKPLTMADQEEWYDRQRQDPTTQMFGIYRDGVLCGVGGLCYIDWMNQHAELSVYVMTRARATLARTLTPEETVDVEGEITAGRLLLRHAFEVFNLHCVWTEAYIPARDHLLTALGFHCDGVRRHVVRREGQWLDARQYSLLDSEWRDAQ